MFKDFIKETQGIQLYPIISLCVFVLFFVVLSIRAMMYNKGELKELGAIPLDDTMDAHEREVKP
jgi:hypothetical protein